MGSSSPPQQAAASASGTATHPRHRGGGQWVGLVSGQSSCYLLADLRTRAPPAVPLFVGGSTGLRPRSWSWC